MIKAIILDVDGVLIGDKQGVNFPEPHPEVIKTLKEYHKRGMPISLCTGKASFGIMNIIKAAELNNLHITDGGAVIIDPLDQIVANKYVMDKSHAQMLLDKAFAKGGYIELFTTDDYYIQKDQEGELTTKHTSILQKPPQLVPSLKDILETKEIVKIIVIVKDELAKDPMVLELSVFNSDLNIAWTTHPSATPAQFAVITSHGISKRNGAEEVAEDLSVPMDSVLGIGDTMHDWDFIELCGYAGLPGNAQDALQSKVKLRDPEKFYIGPSVDDNGIIDILKHFEKDMEFMPGQ